MKNKRRRRIFIKIAIGSEQVCTLQRHVLKIRRERKGKIPYRPTAGGKGQGWNIAHYTCWCIVGFRAGRPGKLCSKFSADCSADHRNEGAKEAVRGFFVLIVAGFPGNDGGQRNPGEPGKDGTEWRRVNKYSQARVTRCKRRAREGYEVDLTGGITRRISRSSYVFRELQVRRAG